MMIPVKKTIWALATLLGCLSSPAPCQSLPRPAVAQAVSTMTRLIEDHYVFAGKGKAIAAQLRKDHQAGRFGAARTWKEFDSLTTRSLVDYSHDGHLYVRHDPNTVQELLEAERKAAADKKDTKGNFSYDPFYYGEAAVANNFGFREVKVLEGNIGYIRLSEINLSEKSLPALFAAMHFVANTKALVIDLQHNGGGGSAVGNVFESFFLPKETPLLEFRTRNGAPRLAKTETWLTEKKYEKPLYILVNGGTASAAEAFTYALQRHGRARVVGQRSAGGAHMNSWYPVNEHLFISVSTGAPTWPGTEESWEGKGIQPDYPVAAGQELEAVKRLIEKVARTD
ncbi:MAG: interphotoreceptor retinoid-binding protein [uncultured Cytophagales bacterium]|uniref:Interphotoreceptor retinoid-binding protein n=1 Tax=uncultured Cytophagales bacterium TaxID=158755 RepID=A0A6J4KFX9_9SPHI|nr:MAG: interphotoreceptor retinoid-binding protein [uncultured Cytophagales bacterium]